MRKIIILLGIMLFVIACEKGNENYQIWSSGRTVEAGKVVKIEIRLTQLPN